MSHTEPRQPPGPSTQPAREQAGDFCPYHPRLLRSAKIQAQHLRRLAVVYVRQSHPQQILRHPGSTALQYALRRYAVERGWPEDRIWIIDDDQGTTGRTAVHRCGFHEIAIEVDLDHVGIVIGIELSRLARCCRDWYYLMEKVCSL